MDSRNECLRRSQQRKQLLIGLNKTRLALTSIRWRTKVIDFIMAWKDEEVELCEQAFRGLQAWEKFYAFCQQAGFKADDVLSVVEGASTEAERIGQSFHINVGN